MRLTISKSKNSESFYITKSYKNNCGKSTSKIVRKLGTLAELSEKLGLDRDGVIKWGKEQAEIETRKFKTESEEKNVTVSFHANRQMDYEKKKFFMGGYLFLQSICYDLRLDKICRKIKSRHSYEYDLNAILSDLIYTRILEPDSKASSFNTAKRFLEPPDYELHDVYRALDILAEECDLIQSEVYKNSNLVVARNDNILYYDCTNYYFEIQDEDDLRRYGKSKEHRPNPIVQMGLFTDGDGIPLAFSLFPGNQNEQKSLKPLETKIIKDFEHRKFIYCSDAGLGSEQIREFNHMGERAFIVTQSLKKLSKEDREWALKHEGFCRLSDDKEVNIDNISDDDRNQILYKVCPYTPKKIHQNLIITYSPKYAAYQKAVREKQIERAKKMIEEGKFGKHRRNPNDPARFIDRVYVTSGGEAAENKVCVLNEDKIAREEMYDGFYAICTDLLDDHPRELIKISESRWQIEACFRILKTEFSARPVFVRKENSIKAHFLICFLALLIYRILEKKLDGKYTCDIILQKLKEMNFVDIEEQGFMPIYERNKLTDDLHAIVKFRTDYQFITKRKMKEIQKLSKGR